MIQRQQACDEQKKSDPIAEDVSISTPTGEINGHAYVDLGLSVKWATCNVGASRPEDYGGHYAWGETRTWKTVEEYNEGNCGTWQQDIADIGGTSRDVAHVKWGGSWRMPTHDELDELERNCHWEYAVRNDVEGYKVTSLKEGYTDRSIFLPVAGSSSYDPNSYNSDGGYWCSTSDVWNDDQHQEANGLYVSKVHFHGGGSVDRFVGLSVRPVSD